jgi:hypothetical protein
MKKIISFIFVLFFRIFRTFVPKVPKVPVVGTDALTLELLLVFCMVPTKQQLRISESCRSTYPWYRRPS